MKKIFRKAYMFIITGFIGISYTNAQTYMSGAGVNTCSTPAGTFGGVSGTYIGCGAGGSGGSYWDTFIGYRAGFNSLGITDNVAVGASSLYTQNYNNPDYASYNVAVGNYALYTNNPTTTNNGLKNTAVGHKALFSNTTGLNNVAHGFQAGYSNTTGYDNVFIGSQAGYSNVTGTTNIFIGTQAGYNCTSQYNTIMGWYAGWGATAATANSGNDNNFIGFQSGYYNTTGYYNATNGVLSLFTNTSGYKNVANGYQALYSNSNGYYNTANGFQALYSNSSGNSNTATGVGALLSNTSGILNTADGAYALTNSTGDKNTAVGENSGHTNTIGTLNTFLGYGADAGANNLSNATAIGSNSSVLTSNTIQLGNSTTRGIFTASSGVFQISDGRFKFNIKEEVPGLEFITKLRPVNYQMDSKKLDEFTRKNANQDKMENKLDYTHSTGIIRTGFIAQEVDKTAKEIGYNFDGVHVPENDNDNYGIAYSSFVVPLVKGMQEQQKMIEDLKKEVAALKGNINTGTGASNSIMLGNNNQAILYQNEPNPFSGSTVIRYFIPDNISGVAFVVFYDMYGKEVNKLELKERGFGKIEANTENLASGIYSYSIIVDGKSIDTKKMIRTQ